MKRFQTLLMAMVATVTTLAQTLNVEIGSVTYQIPAAQAGEMVFTDGTNITILNKVFVIEDITRMYIDDTEVGDNTVSVTYDGTSASVTVAGNVAQFVTPTVNGAHVSIVQSETLTETTGEITYSLSGASTDGEFYLEGSYKATIALRGLTLTNPSGAAINIQDGKRIAVSAKSGTVSTITDGSNGAQKAAFVCKGHTEFKGQGTLNVYGNTAHGIWSKEYVEIKNCTLNVLGAVKDGINCNQYFLLESGSLTLKGIGSDGIQVSYKEELEADRESDDTGEATIIDGTLDITTTGNGAKGIKAEGNVTIAGGSISITQSGKPTTDGTDYSYVASVKADNDINITGGTLTVNNSAMGGRGLTADGTVTIDETQADVSTNVTINVTGDGGTDAEEEESTDSSSSTTTASYKVYVSVPTSSGGGGPGGGNRAWQTVYLYKSDGTLVQQLTSTVTLTSGNTSRTFYVYDFKSATSGTYYFKSDNYTSGGGRGGGTTYTIKSGTFSAPTSGSDVYYTMSSYTTSSSVRTYTLTNATSTWANASSSGSSSDESYTAKGIKADTKVALNAGTITIKATGTGGKGIKSSGTYTMGLTDGTGPTLKVTTTGSALGSSSSSGGGWGQFGPGGMDDSSGGGSAKGIKVQGTIYLYGGSSEVYTSTSGAEGLESKTAIYVEGGNHYFKCYDDCINSKGKIFFNGGVTVCYGYGNDSVDSNAGTTGAITIGNGVVFAYSTKGAPEEGLDCDNNSYIQITGTGIGISAGAAQGGGSSSNTISNAQQGYAFVTSSISYAANRYYTLSDASGNNLVTYSFEASCSSSLALFTATGMVKNSTYYVKYATTAPTDAATAWHGLYLGSTAKGTTSVTSFTAK